VDALVGRCEKIDLSRCRKGRGRSMKNWSEMIRNDLKTLRSTENMA